MRKFLLFAGIALFLTVSASPAPAIVGGTPDGNAHPYVGMVVFYDASGRATHRCSGTLLTKTVFLTAGHCTDGTAGAKVWFDENVTSITTGGVAGTPYTHPDFVLSDFSSPDVGVVVLSKKVSLSTYGVLPPAGIVDDLAHRQGVSSETHTVVGYGLQEVKPTRQALFARYSGTVTISGSQGDFGVGDDFVTYSTNTTKISSGAVCFGDSGGPLLLDNTATVLAVTSSGSSATCGGTDASYRVDVASARAFLGQFVQVP